MPTAHEMNIIAESWKNNLGLTPDEIHARFFAMQRKSQGLDPYGDASDPNRQSRVQLLKSVDIKAEQQRKSAQTPLATIPNLGLGQNIFGLRPNNAVDTSAPLLTSPQLKQQQARFSSLLGVPQIQQNLKDQQDAQHLSPFKMPVNQYQKGPLGIGHVPTLKSFGDNISQTFSNVLDNATDSASQLATSPLSKYMQAHPFMLPQGSPDDGVPAAQRGLEDAGQPASSVSLGELMKASAALPEANKGFLQQLFHNSIYKKPLLDGAGTAWQKDLNASYSPTGVTSGIVPPEWRNSLSFKSPLGDAHSFAPAIETGAGAILDPANILGVGPFGEGARIINGLSREAILGSTEAGLAERAAAFSGMSAAQKAGAFPRLATRQAAERLVHGPVNNANIKLTGNPKITAALINAKVTAQVENRVRHAIPKEPTPGIGKITGGEVTNANKNLSSAKGNAKQKGQNPVKTVISPASRQDVIDSVLPQPLPEPELPTASAPAAPAPEALVPPVPKVLSAVDSDGVKFRSPVVPAQSPLLDARGNPINSSAPSVILDSKGNSIKVVGKDISSLPASPPANTDEFDPFADLRNVFDTTPTPIKAPAKTPEPASHIEPEESEDPHDFEPTQVDGASGKMVPSVETSYGGSGGLYDRSEHGSNPFVRPGGRLRTFFISPHDRATTGPIQTPYGSTFHVDGGVGFGLQPENYDKVSLAQMGGATATRVANAAASTGMTGLMIGSKTQSTTGIQYSQFYKQWLEDAQKYEEAGSSPDIKGALESMKAGYTKSANYQSSKLLTETNPDKAAVIKAKINTFNNLSGQIDPSDPDGLSKLIENGVQYGTFNDRGALMKTLGSPTYSKKFNLPKQSDVLKRYDAPEHEGVPAGQIVKMGFPSQLNHEVTTAERIGSKPHDGYGQLIQGAAPADLPTRPGALHPGFHVSEIAPYGSGRMPNVADSGFGNIAYVLRGDMPTFNLPQDVVDKLGLPVGEQLHPDNALAVAAGTAPKNTGHEEAFSGQYPGPKELIDSIKNSQYSLVSAFTKANDNKAGKLIEDIKASGGRITPVDGSYNGVTESSFRVDGLTPAQVDTLASQYNQDSVIHADGQGGFVLHSTNAKKPFADVQGNGVKFGSQVKSTEPGYSTMYSHQGPIDFSINFDGAAKGSQAADLPGINEGLTGIPANLPSGKVLPKDTSEPDLPGISNALSGEPVLPSGQALAKTNADGTPVASWSPNTTKNEDGYRQHDLLVGPDATPRDLKHEVAHPIWQYMTDAERATMNPILNAATPSELAEARLGRNVAPGSPITDADRSELFANGAQNMIFGNEAAPTSLAGKLQQNLVGPMQRLGYSARQFVPGLSNPISTNPEIQNLILSYTKKNPYSNPLHQESPIGMKLRDDLRDSVTYDSPEDCVNATGGKDKPVLVPNDSVYGSMSGRWIAPKDMAYVNSIFNDNIHYLPFEGLNRSAPAGSPDAPTGAYQGTLPPGLVNLTRFGKSMTTTKSGKLGHYTHIATGDQLAALLNANYSVQNGNGALDYLKNLPAGFKESMANTGPNIDALSKLSPIVGHGTMGAMGGVDEDGPLGKLATWYKATENWPKITLYKTLVDSGIAPEEAAARVADSQIDYGGLPGIVKYAAQSGAMPFLNYSYGSTRFMLNLMAENPSLVRKLGELRQSQFDGYPGSQQQYQNARDYQQNPGVVPTGYDPKTGATNLTNISPALPGTADGLGIPFPNSFALPKTPTLPGVIDAFGQNVNNVEGSITNGVTQLPLVGGLASAVLNKNRYGEPLIDNNTPAGVAGIKDASAITSSLYPQGVTSIGERVFDAINGTPRVQNGGPGSAVGGTSKSVETWPSVFSNWVGAPQSFETPDNPYKIDYNKAIEGMRVANSKYKYEAARGGISPLTSMQRQEALDAYESAKVKYYGPTQVPGQPFVPRVNNADTYPLNPQFLGLPSDSIPPQQPTPSDSTPLVPPAPAAPNQPPPGGYAPSL